MDQIIECVPNFSTADPYTIAEISTAIAQVKGVKLLNVEPDEDYNRVVVTFVGSKETVGEAAFSAIKKATELIDMTSHKGEHPRLGACDVTPFVPVRNVTIEECVEISKSVASRVTKELGVPTYLYGKAATSEDRVKLSDIRKGQYEGLAEKIKQPEWKPDYGPAEFVVKSGAYVLGVRDFLIAYNVNVAEQEVAIAKEVAELVRETGRKVEKDGETVRVPGKLKGIQGMGFPLERGDRKLTQVSMNVVDFRNKAKMHEAFDLVKKLTEERGSQVTGSEIVGLVPLDAILEAGKSYAPEVNNRDELIKVAIKQLGLSDLEEFDPEKKIIELMIETDNLVDYSVSYFIDRLRSDAPAPGGGSVSALGGSLSAALGAMVSRLTIGKEKYQEHDADMKSALVAFEEIRQKLQAAIDEDTRAFNEVMAAFKFPKDNPELRSQKIQEAMTYAAEVPLTVATLSSNLLDHLKVVVEKGNKNAITDVGVAGLFAEAAAKGALYNVKINLMSIKDQATKDEMQTRITTIMENLASKVTGITAIVEKEIS